MRARMERSRRAVGRYPREGGSVEIWRETRAGENGGERRAFGRPAAREDARETASGDDSRCERPAARRTEVFQQLAPEPARADDEDVHHVVEHGFDVLAGLEPRARDGPPAKEETVDVGPSPGKVAAVVHGVRHHRHPGGAARAKRGRVRARESTRGSKTVSGACGHRDDRTSTTHHQWRRTKEQLGPFLGLNDARVHTPRARRVAPAARSRCRPRSRTRATSAPRVARASGSARGRARRGARRSRPSRTSTRSFSTARHAPRTSPRSPRATLADVVPARLAPSPHASARPRPEPSTGPRPPSTLPSSPAARPRCRRRCLSSDATDDVRHIVVWASSTLASPLGASLALALDRIPRGAPRRGAPPAPTAAADSARRGVGARLSLTPPSAAASRPGARDRSTPSRDRTRATRLAAAPHRSASAAGPRSGGRAPPPLRPRAHRARAWLRRGGATRRRRRRRRRFGGDGKTDASPPRVSAGASRSAASPSRGVVSEGLGPSEGFHHLRDPSDLSDEHRVERTLAAVGERLERTPGAIPEGTSSDAVVRRLKAHAAATAATAAMAAGVRKRVASVRGINDAVGSSPSSAGPSSASDSDSDSEPSASSSSSDSDVSSDGSGSDDERSRASAAPPSRPGVFIPSETETSPKQHRRPPPPIENENTDAAASDDDVLMD